MSQSNTRIPAAKLEVFQRNRPTSAIFDHWVTQAVAERRAEARFRRLAAKGNPARGRQFLAEIQRRLAGAKRIDDQQTSGEQTRVERKGLGLAD